MNRTFIIPIHQLINPYHEERFGQLMQQLESFEGEILIVSASPIFTSYSSPYVQFHYLEGADFGQLVQYAVNQSTGAYLYFQHLQAACPLDEIIQMFQLAQENHDPIVKSFQKASASYAYNQTYSLSVYEVYEALLLRGPFRQSLNQIWGGVYQRELFLHLPYPQKVLDGFPLYAFDCYTKAKQVVLYASDQSGCIETNANLYIQIEHLQSLEQRKERYRDHQISTLLIDHRIFALLEALLSHPNFSGLDDVKQAYYRGKYIGLLLKL